MRGGKNQEERKEVNRNSEETAKKRKKKKENAGDPEAGHTPGLIERHARKDVKAQSATGSHEDGRYTEGRACACARVRGGLCACVWRCLVRLCF